MAFLTTADSGQYSPPLSMRAGVHYCAQTLIPDSGRLLLQNTETYNPNQSHLGCLKYQNARINGRFSLENNFEQGYFNFENWSGQVCYDTQWSKSGYQSNVGSDNKPYLSNFWGRGSTLTGETASYNFKYENDRTTLKPNNITTAVTMSGNAGGPYNKMEVYNGTLTSGNITMYGRLGITNTAYANPDKILGFQTLEVPPFSTSTGWIYPTEVFPTGWDNPDNALTLNGSYAETQLVNFNVDRFTSGVLICGAYPVDLVGFSISSIDIKVNWDKEAGKSVNPWIISLHYNGNAIVSRDIPFMAYYPPVFEYTFYQEDWAGIISDDAISDSAFEIGIMFYGDSNAYVYVDTIAININYVYSGSVGLNLMMKDHNGIQQLVWKNSNLSNTTYVGAMGEYIYDNEYVNFLVTYSAQTGYANFYYAWDDEPLTLRSVESLGDLSQLFTGVTKFYEESHDGSVLNNPKIITDYGVSSRLWNSNDVYKFNQHRLNSAYYLTESILTNPPVASGSDVDCVQFHFPVKSSGQIGSCNSTNHRAINYYVPMTSGVSERLYEFDRSQFNSTALALDMWVENSSTNPSGNLGARIDFCDKISVGGYDNFIVKQYWSGFPIQINNDGIHQVRMSGLIYNSSHGLSDLSEVTRNRAAKSQLYYGAWYDNIHTEYNGDIKIYSARCNLAGWCVPLSTGNYMTLYTSGQAKSTGQLDLYVANNYIDNQLDLYINGVNPINSGCTLYINSGFKFDSTTLFVGGKDSQSGDMTLYVEGGTAKAEMPLYLYSQPASEMSGNIPLSIWATEHSGSSKGMTMYIGENAPSGVVSAGMNLYTRGPYSNRLTSNMNLFLRSETPRGDSSCTLYCANYYTGASGTVTLFMKAPSGTLGAIPVSGNMNLFISRDSESTAHNLPLSISGPKSSEGALELAITGSTPNYSSIPLSVDGLGVGTQTIKFYINGF